MLHQAGMLEIMALPMTKSGTGIKSVDELTFYGHEFLENIRPDTVWESTKKKAKSVGSFSIDVLSKLAAQLAIQAATTGL